VGSERGQCGDQPGGQCGFSAGVSMGISKGSVRGQCEDQSGVSAGSVRRKGLYINTVTKYRKRNRRSVRRVRVTGDWTQHCGWKTLMQ